jgi:nitrite reductase (NADH) large subunit
MSPAHAYAKGLRTVKTCVGSDWCRFGTQDSTGLGIRSSVHVGLMGAGQGQAGGLGLPAQLRGIDLQGHRRDLRRPATRSTSAAPRACTSRARYIGRVGLDYVKKKILEDEAGRRALWERLQFALDGEPDPWFESSQASVDVRQFTPVAVVDEATQAA